MLLTFTETRGLSNTLEFRYSIHDFGYACMFWESVKRFRYAVKTKHWTFRSAITVSLYFSFWTTVFEALRTHSQKFVNAVLVYVYNYLCVYRYFSRYSLKTKHATFFSSVASCDFSVHRSLYLSMTIWHFQLPLGSSTSGSKGYFLFKLHSSTSGESSRQQHLMSRLISCILDMCWAWLIVSYDYRGMREMMVVACMTGAL